MENGVDVNNPAYKHGHAGSKGFSPTYHSWASMVQRATNPSRDYSHCYVKRGINVCERWFTFENFLTDMGERPPGTSLDRKNNDRGYEPENCRWATKSEQANNTRANRLVLLHGETKSVTQWCRILGLSINTVWGRVNKWGYSLEDALTKPKQDRTASARRMNEMRIKKG